MIDNIMKGFCLQISSEANRSAQKNLRKLMEKKLIGGYGKAYALQKLLTLMRSSKFHWRIKTP